MSIQVSLLVIDWRGVSVMNLYVLMYRRLFGVPDMITDMTRSLEMAETHLWSITNSETWMLILVPTYSTKIFIGQTA